MTVELYLNSDPAKRVPMTRDQTDLFLRCTLAERVQPEMFNENHANECGAVGQILYHRLQLQGPVEVTLGLAGFIMSLTEGIPGKVVMWAYTLNRMFKKKAESIGGPLDMEDLAFCFPMGFPIDEEEGRLWDAQKGGEANVAMEDDQG